ncbi:hypothetical protein SMQC19_46960 (plasmid) [Serratia marcescens]|nr:hypothetical protein SMQC19_46960 [Serratia marcescens]
MRAMYNPETIQLDHGFEYKKIDTIGSEPQYLHFITAKPGGLDLTLLFDSQMPGNTTPIETQLKKLKYLCNLAISKPYFLRITWGKMRWENKGWFTGRVEKYSATYTLFDRDATPLRANVTLSLAAEESGQIQQAISAQNSPNRALVSVPDLASLPLLALSAGGALAGSVDPLSLAWDNDLDNLDDFQSGDLLRATKRGEA